MGFLSSAQKQDCSTLDLQICWVLKKVMLCGYYGYGNFIQENVVANMHLFPASSEEALRPASTWTGSSAEWLAPVVSVMVLTNIMLSTVVVENGRGGGQGQFLRSGKKWQRNPLKSSQIAHCGIRQKGCFPQTCWHFGRSTHFETKCRKMPV